MKKLLSKLLLSGAALCVLSSVSTAQEAHFSQFAEAPLLLNPAHTGATYGDWRLAANYRNQWAPALNSPITSAAFSFDIPIYFGDNRLGLGLVAMMDDAGDKGYNTTKFAGSFSYIAALGYAEIRFGAQAGYTMRAIDEELSFPADFDPNVGVFVPGIGNSEDLKSFSSGHLNINAGLSWAMTLDNFRPEVGIAMFNVNSPVEGFLDQPTKIDPLVAGHASFKIFMNDMFYVDPNGLVMAQGSAKNIIAGLRVGAKFKSNDANFTGIYGGVSVRNGFSENPDAIIGTLGLGFANIDLGVSYDITQSDFKLPGTANNGSFEFSLRYTAPSTKIIKTKIDSERL